MARASHKGPVMLHAYLPLKAVGVLGALWLGAATPAPEETHPRVTDVEVGLAPPSQDVVTVTLHDDNVGTTAVVQIGRDGSVDEANEKMIRRLFRCRRTHKERAIDHGLLAMLADLQARYPEKPIHFVSAYRGHKQESKTSPHRGGRALDLRIPGVRDTVIRDYLWRTHREVGVGWYPKLGFVHIDHRPGEHDIAWTEIHGKNQYHPSWADRARRERAPESVDHKRAQRAHRPGV